MNRPNWQWCYVKGKIESGGFQIHGLYVLRCTGTDTDLGKVSQIITQTGKKGYNAFSYLTDGVFFFDDLTEAGNWVEKEATKVFAAMTEHTGSETSTKIGETSKRIDPWTGSRK